MAIDWQSLLQNMGTGATGMANSLNPAPAGGPQSMNQAQTANPFASANGQAIGQVLGQLWNRMRPQGSGEAPQGSFDPDANASTIQMGDDTGFRQGGKVEKRYAVGGPTVTPAGGTPLANTWTGNATAPQAGPAVAPTGLRPTSPLSPTSVNAPPGYTGLTPPAGNPTAPTWLNPVGGPSRFQGLPIQNGGGMMGHGGAPVQGPSAPAGPPPGLPGFTPRAMGGGANGWASPAGWTPPSTAGLGQGPLGGRQLMQPDHALTQPGPVSGGPALPPQAPITGAGNGSPLPQAGNFAIGGMISKGLKPIGLRKMSMGMKSPVSIPDPTAALTKGIGRIGGIKDEVKSLRDRSLNKSLDGGLAKGGKVAKAAGGPVKPVIKKACGGRVKVMRGSDRKFAKGGLIPTAAATNNKDNTKNIGAPGLGTLPDVPTVQRVKGSAANPPATTAVPKHGAAVRGY